MDWDDFAAGLLHEIGIDLDRGRSATGVTVTPISSKKRLTKDPPLHGNRRA